MTVSLSWINARTGTLDYIRFDVVTSETRESLMTITDHPVEDGSNVVDHARELPKKVSIEGFVSNKPLWSNPGMAPLADYTARALALPSPPRGLRPARRRLDLPKPPLRKNLASLVQAGIGAIFPPGDTYATLAAEAPADQPLQATVLAANADFPDRARAMYEALLAAQAARTLFTVSSSSGEIDNMLIEKISVPRTVDTGNGADFSIELTQVRIVKSETVAAPLPAEVRGAKEVSMGSQSAKASPKLDKLEGRPGSILFKTKEELVDYAKKHGLLD